MAGYYDESDDVERGYSMAGFIGHQHDCVHLDFAWKRKILDKYEIEYFKASELNGGRGEFAKFRDDPAGDLNKPFSKREKDLFDQVKVDSIDVILDFDLLVGLGVNLVLPDYHRLYEEYKRLGKTLAAPYFFCAQLLMMESGFIMHKVNSGGSTSQQGLIRPVFDSHEEYSGRAKQMFDEFCTKNPISSRALLPPHYEDDKQYLVLQAADNLAYECRRLLITEDFDTHIPERTAMKRLKQCIYKIYKLNYKSLKAILEAQAPDVIPLEAEIHNRHELLGVLDKVEREANEAGTRVRGLRPHNAESNGHATQRDKSRSGCRESSQKNKQAKD